MADVANSKRHQRLDEILIIFTRSIQEISKVVYKKTMSETCAFITSLCCMKRVQGRSQTFQNEGAARGAQGWAGGLTADSKWWLSIDLSTKCNFIWGGQGGQSSARGAVAPCPPLCKQDCVKFPEHIARQSEFVFFKQFCRFLWCSAGKKKNQDLFSRWWHFQLATSPTLNGFHVAVTYNFCFANSL